MRTDGDPQSFNPDNSGDDLAYAINQNLFSRLVKLDASKQIVPDLANPGISQKTGKPSPSTWSRMPSGTMASP